MAKIDLIKTKENIENLNTSKCNNLAGIFCGCHNLTNLNVNGWDTSNSTYALMCFSDCKSAIICDCCIYGNCKCGWCVNIFRDFNNR